MTSRRPRFGKRVGAPGGAEAPREVLPISPDRLGTGTPSASTVLYGTGVWAPVAPPAALPAEQLIPDALPAADALVTTDEIQVYVTVTGVPKRRLASSIGTGFVIENRTSDPGAPATGQIWLRTDL